MPLKQGAFQASGPFKTLNNPKLTLAFFSFTKFFLCGSSLNRASHIAYPTRSASIYQVQKTTSFYKRKHAPATKRYTHTHVKRNFEECLAQIFQGSWSALVGTSQKGNWSWILCVLNLQEIHPLCNHPRSSKHPMTHGFLPEIVGNPTSGMRMMHMLYIINYTKLAAGFCWYQKITSKTVK